MFEKEWKQLDWKGENSNGNDWILENKFQKLVINLECVWLLFWPTALWKDIPTIQVDRV